MRKMALTLVVSGLCWGPAVLALVPAKPGVPVPQAVINAYQQNPDRFYPRPMLANTMARYAAAKREAVLQGRSPDEVDDIYAHAPVVCGKYIDSPPGNPWPVSQIQEELFDGPWPTLTMHDFYEEISYNQFHLDGSAYGWYTSPLTLSYVIGSYYGLQGDAHVGEFIADLLDGCDPTTDFGQFDNDGPDNVPNSGDDDGIVDALIVIHEGGGAEAGANNIWSHSSNLLWAANYNQYYVTNDPRTGGGHILIGPYIIQPAVNSSNQIIEIGVFCHEFGHALGLPDLYDTDYSSQGVGNWCLMGGGSWNTPTSPAHMLAWCRYQLGWITPTETTTWLHDQPISAIETSGQAFKLWTEGINYTEYFMVENRRRIGSDVHLPGEGLCIWHIDLTGQQSNEAHPLVGMEQADGRNDLANNSNAGDTGDVYPGNTDNRWFDEYTNPNSNNYYGNPTQVAVWNISDASDTMMANLDVVYSQPLLEFVEDVVIDSAGNNDGRADPGETVQLYAVLENLWAATNDLTGFLSTTSGYADITDSVGQYSYLAHQGTGSNAASPFEIFVHSDAPEGAWLPLNLHLTTPGGFSQDLQFSIQIGRAPILLVDDDQGLSYDTLLAGSLNETNVNYEVWHVNQQGSPASQLLEYSVVLWMTGNDSLSTLSGAEMNAIEGFLAAGRTFILTGQNINEDIGSSDFFRTTLRCTPRTGDVNTIIVNGDSTNAISSGMMLLIFGAGSANNQTSPSSVYPEGSQSLFVYPNGEVAGVNYWDESSGAHVVYLAFGLEAVSGIGFSSSRAEILTAIFAWVNSTAVEPPPLSQTAPDAFRFDGAFPNPFNPTTVISFELRAASFVSLKVYDTAGRLVTTLADGWREEGEDRIEFDGSGLASGIYIYRLKAGSNMASGKMVLMK